LQAAALFWVDLHGDVRSPFAPFASLLVHDAAKEDPEVPVIHLETQEEEGAVAPGPHYRWRDVLVVLGHADQIVEAVVFGENDRIPRFHLAEEVIDQRAPRTGSIVGLRV